MDNRWNNLSMSEKNQLLGIYVSKGYTDLASIISHYNSFAEGGDLGDPPNNKSKTSLLDTEKVYNRLPADATEYFSLGVPVLDAVTRGISALRKYYTNDDDYVNRKINQAKEILTKTENDVSDTHPLITKYDLTKKEALEKLQFQAKHLLALEDAKDVYLNMPQRTGTVIPATEKPTMRHSTKPLYKNTLLQDPYTIQNYWLPAINNLKLKRITPERIQEPGDITSIGKSGKNAVTLLPVIGNATVGYGIDPKKGEYISYYDTWDINLSGKGNTKDTVAKYIGGHPFDLYDRIYLDEYYNVDTTPQDKNTYYAGWLPELTVWDYADGPSRFDHDED